MWIEMNQNVCALKTLNEVIVHIDGRSYTEYALVEVGNLKKS